MVSSESALMFLNLTQIKSTGSKSRHECGEKQIVIERALMDIVQNFSEKEKLFPVFVLVLQGMHGDDSHYARTTYSIVIRRRKYLIAIALKTLS
jgi:hypothetical protein